MNIQDNILDSSLLDLKGDFNSQVSYLLDNIRLSRSEVEGLTDLFRDLENVLVKTWPGCKIFPFGSIVTGLGIRSSDVDCYVALPHWEQKSSKKIVMRVKNILSRHVYCYIFTELFAIPQAKIPIVKFYHVPTQRYCDVSFTTPAGVENSKLIAYLLHIDSRGIPLAVLIKYWSKVHSLTGTNLIPNYGLTMLVIFFLQHVGILPPVAAIQSGAEPVMVDNWNTAFNEKDFRTENKESLYQLMAGFFEYYSNFDFENNIISPYFGKVLKRELFRNLNTLPHEFNLYKSNLKNGLCVPLKLDSKICIQDPFQHCRNSCVAVYPKLADKLLLLFRKAAKTFKDDEHSCLKEILKKVDGEDALAPQKLQNNHIKKGAVGKIIKHKRIRQRQNQNMINLFEQYKKQRGRR